MAACISTFTCIPVSVFLYLYPCICISIPFYAPWLDAVEPVSVYSKVVEEGAGGFSAPAACTPLLPPPSLQPTRPLSLFSLKTFTPPRCCQVQVRIESDLFFHPPPRSPVTATEEDLGVPKSEIDSPKNSDLSILLVTSIDKGTRDLLMRVVCIQYPQMT